MSALRRRPEDDAQVRSPCCKAADGRDAFDERLCGGDDQSAVVDGRELEAAFGVGAYLLRRIGPTIIAHAIFNAVVLMVLLWGPDDSPSFDFDDAAGRAIPRSAMLVPITSSSAVAVKLNLKFHASAAPELFELRRKNRSCAL